MILWLFPQHHQQFVRFCFKLSEVGQGGIGQKEDKDIRNPNTCKNTDIPISLICVTECSLANVNMY